jgi:phosphoglucosamine mutase
MRIAVDCANGAYSHLAPKAFAQLGADVHAIGDEPNGDNINVGVGATDLAALQQAVTSGGYDLGIAFDGDGDRMLAVDANGDVANGDELIAILAFHLNVDLVAVTSMSNLGLHKLLSDHGIRVITTDVGDRYVLEALYRENGVLGGEQSGHIICLRDHVTGDGLAAALLLCAALQGHPLHTVRRAMIRYPQVTKNLPRNGRGPLPDALKRAVEAVNSGLGDEARVLVRPSGTEPLVRVLAEAPTQAEAEELCATVAALVTKELG